MKRIAAYLFLIAGAFALFYGVWMFTWASIELSPFLGGVTLMGLGAYGIAVASTIAQKYL